MLVNGPVIQKDSKNEVQQNVQKQQKMWIEKRGRELSFRNPKAEGEGLLFELLHPPVLFAQIQPGRPIAERWKWVGSRWWSHQPRTSQQRPDSTITPLPPTFEDTHIDNPRGHSSVKNLTVKDYSIGSFISSSSNSGTQRQVNRRQQRLTWGRRRSEWPVWFASTTRCWRWTPSPSCPRPWPRVARAARAVTARPAEGCTRTGHSTSPACKKKVAQTEEWVISVSMHVTVAMYHACLDFPNVIRHWHRP